ncbi:MAG: hypothetical protein AB1649_03120 [Chloroflexota bacterium]
MTSLLERFLPKTEDRIDRTSAVLVLSTSGAVILGSLVFILFWIFTASLEELATVAAGVVLVIIVFGIMLLVRRGNIRLGLWVLTSLMAILTLEISREYGVSTLSSAGFVIPIVLAACGAGLWAGLLLALIGSAGMWAIAFASSTGALQPWLPYEISNLTFDAPFLTILFFLVAFILGVWRKEMGR